MHAIGLGALQQRHVAQAGRGLFERARTDSAASARWCGSARLPPARDQPRPLVERGIDEMGDAGEFGRERWRTPRRRRDRADTSARRMSRRDWRRETAITSQPGLRCEMLHGGIADEAGGAGDQDFSGRHGTDWKGMSGATAFWTIRRRGRTLPKCACDTALFFGGSFRSQANEQVSCRFCVGNGPRLRILPNSAQRRRADDAVDGSGIKSQSLELAL